MRRSASLADRWSESRSLLDHGARHARASNARAKPRRFGQPEHTRLCRQQLCEARSGGRNCGRAGRDSGRQGRPCSSKAHRAQARLRWGDGPGLLLAREPQGRRTANVQARQAPVLLRHELPDCPGLPGGRDQGRPGRRRRHWRLRRCCTPARAADGAQRRPGLQQGLSSQARGLQGLERLGAVTRGVAQLHFLEGTDLLPQLFTLGAGQPQALARADGLCVTALPRAPLLCGLRLRTRERLLYASQASPAFREMRRAALQAAP
mmetsp:Transcript_88140/g.285271  ORF Transcript_88140/g.285271 Transcript_88140/m.285271 type:complete len:264 (+) Transcript_88140:89-880(+)